MELNLVSFPNVPVFHSELRIFNPEDSLSVYKADSFAKPFLAVTCSQPEVSELVPLSLSDS